MQQSVPERIYYLDTPTYKIYVEPTLKLVCLHGTSNIPSHVYREGLSLATELAKEQQLHYWLINNVQAGVISVEDQIWSNQVIAPVIASETVICKMACVESQHLLNKMIVENMIREASSVFQFEVQFFSDEPSARAWFFEQEPAL